MIGEIRQNPTRQSYGPIASLFLGFALLVLCFFLTSSLLGVFLSPEARTVRGAPEAASAGALMEFRLAQGIASLMIWGLAALLWSVLQGNVKDSLSLRGDSRWQLYLWACLAMVLSLPFLQWLLFDPDSFRLPEFMKETEAWMESGEAESKRLIGVLLGDPSSYSLLVNLLVVALIPALSEELFFRSFLLGTLKRRLNGHVAVWLSAGIFSAIHFQFLGFFPRLVLGAMLGYFFLWTGSIRVSIFAHFFNNFFSVLLGVWAINKGYEAEVIHGKTELPLIFVGLSLLLTTFILYLFFRGTQKHAQSDFSP